MKAEAYVHRDCVRIVVSPTTDTERTMLDLCFKATIKARILASFDDDDQSLCFMITHTTLEPK